MKATAVLSLLFAAAAVATPLADGSEATYNQIEKRGCTRNTGDHCNNSRMPGQDVGSKHSDIDEAVRDLMTNCGSNGRFPSGAKRVTSKPVNGVVAYACNSFCKWDYMPCQDAGWSISRVRDLCKWQRMGWDSQESRGSWYGIGYMDESPCGYGYTQGVTWR